MKVVPPGIKRFMHTVEISVNVEELSIKTEVQLSAALTCQRAESHASRASTVTIVTALNASTPDSRMDCAHFTGGPRSYREYIFMFYTFNAVERKHCFLFFRHAAFSYRISLETDKGDLCCV